MEIIIVAAIDPNLIRPGGIRSYVLNLIQKFQEKKIKSTLIGISNIKGEISSNHLFTFIPIVKHRNISCYEFFLNLLLKVHCLKLPRYSIIHAQRPDIILPFIFFFRKNPKVCTLHGFNYRGLLLKKNFLTASIYRLMENFTLRRTDRLIAVDEGTRKYYLKEYPWLKEKIIVIPIGIDTQKFRPMDKYQIRKKYGFEEKDRIILYVGRLEKEKDLEFLLRSFKKINDPSSNLKLLLVGEGRERANLENLAKELELKNVIFMGTFEYNKIPEIINCGDVFVLTSIYESGPLVIQETLSCGVPVVTTDVGRVREFIKNDEVGRIVNRNENEFGIAIKEMLEEDQDKTRNACIKASINFDFETTAGQTIEAYKNLKDIRQT